MSLRDSAREIFLETLRRVRVEDVIRSFVQVSECRLSVGESEYDLRRFDHVVVIAIGKASGPMWEGIVPALEGCGCPGLTIESIVVGPHCPRADGVGFRHFPGSHPIPDHNARMAADSILTTLSGVDERTLVLFLISGGASAMVEKPIDPGMSEGDVRAFYQALVHSGLPIARMNALRKHFSQVKGGRLALAAGLATQCTVLISDVPDDRLDVIGSGPSLPDPSTVADCLEIVMSDARGLRLPEPICEFFRNNLSETPKRDDAAFSKSSWQSMLSSRDLVREAGRIASDLGFRVVVDDRCDDWDYRDAAKYLVDRLEQICAEPESVCLLSSGELSVELESQHGIGGRNQQFALECARLLAERNLDATALSGGSDGIDGNSPATGAVCDRTTWTRAALAGFDPGAALRGFDSYPLFDALGDAIVMGPTGNNLRDLRILLRRLREGDTGR